MHHSSIQRVKEARKVQVNRIDREYEAVVCEREREREITQHAQQQQQQEKQDGRRD